jgi:Domain of Unknown Function with PDB structure (DUF3857)/Transglutaminase-like superfamily
MRFFKISRSFALLLTICGASPAWADAPAWMHNLVGVSLPVYDEKTSAVLLYSDDVLTIQSNGKLKHLERRAYKILRPEGSDYGTVRADMSSESRVVGMHGWCIPAQGKDYEVKDKEAIETALTGLENGELVSDVKSRFLRIPAADPGNIVGYEVEYERQPYVLQDAWGFQHYVPVREAHFTLQLAPGWEYRAVWLNHAEVQPTSSAGGQIQWSLSDIKAIRPEVKMPPWVSVSGTMLISLFPRDGKNAGFRDWASMGKWEEGLSSDRRDVSPEIKNKVAELTANATTPVEKINALATFTQKEIRYVAIQLGIGGWQPHHASEVFQHRYGDCKDKAILLSTMLQQVGIESYYLDVNTERGVITPETPATRWFDHVILAIKLPEGTSNSSLAMVYTHPKLGKLLIFDPTDQFTPLGQLSGELQAGYALLVTPDGGELIKVPQLSASLNGITRKASAVLDAQGNLTGTFNERRLGDAAAEERARMKFVSADKDRLKAIEGILSGSLANFAITKASITSLQDTHEPFQMDYSIAVQRYAKPAGDLLLVRPRLIGVRSSSLLETKEARQLPVIFDGPRRDTDTFEITMPAGYEVDDLPPAVDLHYSFASYHSKTEAAGNTLKYTRTLEIKELSVPMEKMDELRKFYRVIASDERNTAVLKPSSAAASAK